MNPAMTSILENLRDGPKTTVFLQRFCGTTHAAKPVYDLRQLGYVISRKSLPNRVALYTLISEPGAPVGAGERATTQVGDLSRPGSPASSKAPVFGDVQLIREMRRR